MNKIQLVDFYDHLAHPAKLIHIDERMLVLAIRFVDKKKRTTEPIAMRICLGTKEECFDSLKTTIRGHAMRGRICPDGFNVEKWLGHLHLKRLLRGISGSRNLIDKLLNSPVCIIFMETRWEAFLRTSSAKEKLAVDALLQLKMG